MNKKFLVFLLIVVAVSVCLTACTTTNNDDGGNAIENAKARWDGVFGDQKEGLDAAEDSGLLP